MPFIVHETTYSESDSWGIRQAVRQLVAIAYNNSFKPDEQEPERLDLKSLKHSHHLGFRESFQLYHKTKDAEEHELKNTLMNKYDEWLYFHVVMNPHDGLMKSDRKNEFLDHMPEWGGLSYREQLASIKNLLGDNDYNEREASFRDYHLGEKLYDFLERHIDARYMEKYEIRRAFNGSNDVELINEQRLDSAIYQAYKKKYSFLDPGREGNNEKEISRREQQFLRSFSMLSPDDQTIMNAYGIPFALVSDIKTYTAGDEVGFSFYPTFIALESDKLDKLFVLSEEIVHFIDLDLVVNGEHGFTRQTKWHEKVDGMIAKSDEQSKKAYEYIYKHRAQNKATLEDYGVDMYTEVLADINYIYHKRIAELPEINVREEMLENLGELFEHFERFQSLRRQLANDIRNQGYSPLSRMLSEPSSRGEKVVRMGIC